jgi:hypothetical protein
LQHLPAKLSNRVLAPTDGRFKFLSQKFKQKRRNRKTPDNGRTVWQRSDTGGAVNYCAIFRYFEEPKGPSRRY